MTYRVHRRPLGEDPVYEMLAVAPPPHNSSSTGETMVAQHQEQSAQGGDTVSLRQQEVSRAPVTQAAAPQAVHRTTTTPDQEAIPMADYTQNIAAFANNTTSTGGSTTSRDTYQATLGPTSTALHTMAPSYTAPVNARTSYQADLDRMNQQAVADREAPLANNRNRYNPALFAKAPVLTAPPTLPVLSPPPAPPPPAPPPPPVDVDPPVEIKEESGVPGWAIGLGLLLLAVGGYLAYKSSQEAT